MEKYCTIPFYDYIIGIYKGVNGYYYCLWLIGKTYTEYDLPKYHSFNEQNKSPEIVIIYAINRASEILKK